VFPAKRIVAFFVSAAVLYLLLMILWPVVQPAYAPCYRAVAGLVFSSFGAANSIRFAPAQDASRPEDSLIIARHKHTGAGGDFPHSSRKTGYVPTAVLVSLVLATPLPWRRRWRALLWGLVLVNVFVGVRIGLIVLHYLGADPRLGFFDLSPTERKLAEWAVQAFVQVYGSSFGFPVFIWLAVTFRRGDWHSLFGAPAHQSADEPPGPSARDKGVSDAGSRRSATRSKTAP
jgi:hypothetical protein